jgi:hypothetical protein
MRSIFGIVQLPVTVVPDPEFHGHTHFGPP